jgi:hypothetical protein
MATQLLGTDATNSLTALVMNTQALPADFATIAQGIKNDKIAANGSHPIFPGAFNQMGLLAIPNRGILQVLPGDVVAIDNNGWPILVSAASIAYGATGLWNLT